MPHITEELWSLLGLGKGSIQFAAPPGTIPLEDADIANKRKLVSAIYQTVQAGRNLRAEAKIPSNKKARFILRPADKDAANELPTITRLLNADEVTLDRQYKAKPGVPVAMAPLGEIFLGNTGTDKKAEQDRLDREIAKIGDELETVKMKLKNKSFVDRAPAAVVEEHRQRQKNFAEQLRKLKEARKSLT